MVLLKWAFYGDVGPCPHLCVHFEEKQAASGAFHEAILFSKVVNSSRVDLISTASQLRVAWDVMWGERKGRVEQRQFWRVCMCVLANGSPDKRRPSTSVLKLLHGS